MSKNQKLENLDFHAPVDNADNYGTYRTALQMAINAPRICNIALAGPYGSGKSSILTTFFKNNETINKETVWVSMASFDRNDEDEERLQAVPDTRTESGGKTGDQDINRQIEQSILQQIFYSVKKSELPYSKIKRIENIGWKQLILYPALIVLYLISIYVLKINTLYAINIGSTGVYFFLALLALLTVYGISKIMTLLSGVRLSKFVISQAEFSLVDQNDTSVSLLNRHIDEIIYFFEETKKRILVIEDLDRFNNRNIFIKLREINTLLNEAIPERKIIFIYAVKDDLFAGENRPKFFDAIIPVIPYVNATGGARDLLKAKLQSGGVYDLIGQRLLNDISLYIHDYRLLSNICNEFLVYLTEMQENETSFAGQNESEHETMDGLETYTEDYARKLFALIVYKNFFPEDFARLHQSQGWVYSVFHEEKEKLIIDRINGIKKNIDKLKERVETAEVEHLTNVQEAKLINVSEALKSTATNSNQQIASLRLRNTYCTPMQISEDPKLYDSFLQQNQNSIQCVLSNGGTGNYRLSIDIEQANSRLERLEDKDSETLKQLRKKIATEERVISHIHGKNLSQLLEYSKGNPFEKMENLYVDSCNPTKTRTKEEIKKREAYESLLTYLIRNGHIDEDYGKYLSYLHKGGALTYGDMRYIKAVIDRSPPNIETLVDSPINIIEEMDPDLFRLPVSYNLTITHYLFSAGLLDGNGNAAQKALLGSMASRDQHVSGLIRAYIERYGISGSDFLVELAAASSGMWEYLADLLDEKQLQQLATEILFSETTHAFEEMGDDYKSYLSGEANILESLSRYDAISDLVYERLKGLKFINMGKILNTQGKELVTFIFKKRLFRITPEMLREFYKADEQSEILDFPAVNTGDYSFLKSKGKTELTGLIEENKDEYVDNTLTTLRSENPEFDFVPTVEALLHNPKENESFANTVLNLFPRAISEINGIDTYYWRNALESDAIRPTWQNLCKYFKHANMEFDNVLQLYTQTDRLTALLDSEFDIGPNECLTLLDKMIVFPKLPEESFDKLLEITPTYDSFVFEELDEARIAKMIKGRKLSPSRGHFDEVRSRIKEERDMLANLLAINLEAAFAWLDESMLDEEDYYFLLLNRELSFEQREKLLNMALSVYSAPGAQLQQAIAMLTSEMVQGEVRKPLSFLALQIALDKIENIQDKAKALTYCMPIEPMEIASLVEMTGYPYSQLVEEKAGKVELVKTPLNIELLTKMVERDMLSSLKEKDARLSVYRKTKWRVQSVS